MSFKVKDLAMNVGGGNVDEASTCSTWTRISGGNAGCANSGFLVDGPGGRNLSVLRAQLRRAVTRA
ncbi:MAG TPA: hypothetical protein VH394_26380 [Thermoanaerobaculia bacterium]|jgi:hypothetical protein|nr:hypothetical protein [Thermoanaerobaculia bacterium]